MEVDEVIDGLVATGEPTDGPRTCRASSVQCHSYTVYPDQPGVGPVGGRPAEREKSTERRSVSGLRIAAGIYFTLGPAGNLPIPAKLIAPRVRIPSLKSAQRANWDQHQRGDTGLPDTGGDAHCHKEMPWLSTHLALCAGWPATHYPVSVPNSHQRCPQLPALQNLPTVARPLVNARHRECHQPAGSRSGLYWGS